MLVFRVLDLVASASQQEEVQGDVVEYFMPSDVFKIVVQIQREVTYIQS